MKAFGFRFTEEEVKAMQFAMRSALKYMKTYGKGAKVAMIDLSHYAQNDNK